MENVSGASSHQHHIIPFNIYIRVLIALLFLTVLTVVAAQIDFGEWNVVIAILIATVKASLVLSFFMHLRYDDKQYLVIFLTGIFFLSVMYLFSYLDIVTRLVQNAIL